MRMVKFAAALFLAAVIASGAQAAEKGAKLTGELSDKPADAKAGVVAVLTVKARKPKDGAAAGPDKKYNLVADGDVAKQLGDLKGKRVQVTGSGTEDEYKVTAVAEAAAKKAK